MDMTNKNNEFFDMILIATPPFQVDRPPLGVGYLSSFIRTKGFTVKVMDLNIKLFKDSDDDKRKMWAKDALLNPNNLNNTDLSLPECFGQEFIEAFYKELREAIDTILGIPSRIVGFSTTSASVFVAQYIAHQIKLCQPSKIVIFGGPGFMDHFFEVDRQHLIDIFVVGEGEMPLLNILTRFRQHQTRESLLGIKGTIMWRDSEYQRFLPPDNVKCIDDIPFPTFSKFDLNDYDTGQDGCCLPLIISRGCINQCSFCVDCHLNGPYRFRSPANVIKEILYHVQVNKISKFALNDLLCNGNLNQLEEICDLINAHNLNIQWTSNAVVREGMTQNLFIKMKKAGCYLLDYGLESGSDIVLKKMNKRYTVGVAQDVIRMTHGAGIITAVNIVLGFPGEREHEFKETCKFIERNRKFIDVIGSVSIFTLMPGTDVAKSYQNYDICFPFQEEKYKFCVLDDQPVKIDQRFCVNEDNIPQSRAQRLREFMTFLYKVNLPYLVINRPVEQDNDFDELLKSLKIKSEAKHQSAFVPDNIVRSRFLFLSLDVVSKKVNILYDAHPCKTMNVGEILFKNKKQLGDRYSMLLTRHFGLNSSFYVDNQWYDSSCAKWFVRKRNNRVCLHIQWCRIPIFQEWTLWCKGRSMQWRIRTWFERGVNVAQIKAGIYLANDYRNYFSNDEWHSFPAVFDNDWHDVILPSLSTSVRNGNSSNDLPTINIKGTSNRDIAIQVQTTPSHLSARMVNVCYLVKASSQHGLPVGAIEEQILFTKKNPLEFNIQANFLSKNINR
ncbi:MAG: B12-binding domain-containing radical SAM protein [Candidatus Omnitrophica bacterium]|nr:B12-binding domain-containing radical SAM protein [Candidatus Omnitrophota bacterium]